jgi:chlorobactene glucosyltransferase
MILNILGGLVAFAFFILFFTAVANWRFFPRLRRPNSVPDLPILSILIPARNEAAVIAGTVRAVLSQTVENFEFLLLDDASTDGTAARARAAAGDDPRLRILTGAPLPAGWLGKNWACHQLAEAASGDLLLFLDADVQFDPDALAALLALQTESTADLLTVWPTQETHTWSERLVVPLMALAIWAYLPILPVHYTSWPAFAAANGQCLLFTRAGYHKSGRHTAVRDNVVEDVALARRIKAAGGRLRMADGGGLIGCRMYDGWTAVRDGFAKNILAGHGQSVLFLLLSTIFHWLVFIFPWVWLLIAPGLWPLLLAAAGVGLRALTAWGTRQRVGDAIFMPISVILMTRIALQSIWWRRRGRGEWKGRKLVVES